MMPRIQRYKRRAVVVEAYRVAGEVFLDAPQGVMKAGAGDWIIISPDGSRHPCRDEVFRGRYELVGDGESLEALLSGFACAHLPGVLKEVAFPFAVLADRVAAGGECEEMMIALRKLLEAKDAAVLARLSKEGKGVG